MSDKDLKIQGNLITEKFFGAPEWCVGAIMSLPKPVVEPLKAGVSGSD